MMNVNLSKKKIRGENGFLSSVFCLVFCIVIILLLYEIKMMI